jgi:hypothetical protein
VLDIQGQCRRRGVIAISAVVFAMLDLAEFINKGAALWLFNESPDVILHDLLLHVTLPFFRPKRTSLP